MSDTLQVKLLSENATLPIRGSPDSAGFDLASAVNLIIPPNQRALVKTDLSIACPKGTYGRVAPRSGLAYKKGIDVMAGVIDADYRGPVGVILVNLGKDDFEITKGDRIAQLVLEVVCMADVQQVEELDDTVRGSGGFGSTGVKGEPEEKKQRTVSPTNKDAITDAVEPTSN